LTKHKFMIFQKRNHNRDTRKRAFCHSIAGRKNQQQDACLITDEFNSRRLLLVADGVSSSKAAAYASQKTIEIFKNFFPSSTSFPDIKDFLRKTVFLVASVFLNESIQNPSMKDAATTLSGVYILRNDFYTINIGDSRVYLFSNNKLKRLTTDHSIITEMIEQGIISPEEAKKSSLGNIITSVISSNLSDIKIDIEGPFKLKEKDIIIISTDGLHDYLSDNEIENIIKQNNNFASLAKTLVSEAFNNNSKDNITVITYKH